MVADLAQVPWHWLSGPPAAIFPTFLPPGELRLGYKLHPSPQGLGRVLTLRPLSSASPSAQQEQPYSDTRASQPALGLRWTACSLNSGAPLQLVSTWLGAQLRPKPEASLLTRAPAPPGGLLGQGRLAALWALGRAGLPTMSLRKSGPTTCRP